MPAPGRRRPTRRKGSFSAALLAVLTKGTSLRIRAGERHRFIGIWMVVVGGRLFVRSWSLKPQSWWRAFLVRPVGAIQVAGRAVPVRAIQTRSERLNDAVSRAYLEKYGTGAMRRYARDLGSPKSRATTTELVPL
jgi:hypothetical protein